MTNHFLLIIFMEANLLITISQTPMAPNPFNGLRLIITPLINSKKFTGSFNVMYCTSRQLAAMRH